jgi:hypothetical protein
MTISVPFVIAATEIRTGLLDDLAADAIGAPSADLHFRPHPLLRLFDSAERANLMECTRDRSAMRLANQGRVDCRPSSRRAAAWKQPWTSSAVPSVIPPRRLRAAESNANLPLD